MSEWRPAGGSAARTLVLASVRVSEVVFSPSLILPPHEHEKNTLAITLGGEYQASSRSADVLGPARISVEPCGLRHSCQFGPHGARVLVIQPLQELEGTCRRLFTEGRVLQDRSIASVAWRIGTELKANDASTPLIVEGLTLEILGASTRAVTRKETSVRHHDGVTRAEQMVRSCLHGPLRMQDVARASGVPALRLQRLFRARYGMPIGAYHRGLRLVWAANRLASTDSSLLDVALDAGFADQSHFTRIFVRAYGMTPGRYRRDGRKTGTQGPQLGGSSAR